MADPEEAYQALATHLKNDEEGLELASKLWEAYNPPSVCLGGAQEWGGLIPPVFDNQIMPSEELATKICPGCQGGAFSNPFCSDECHDEWIERECPDSGPGNPLPAPEPKGKIHPPSTVEDWAPGLWDEKNWKM